MKDENIDNEKEKQEIFKSIGETLQNLFDDKRKKAKSELDEITEKFELSSDEKIEKIKKIELLFLINEYTAKVMKNFNYNELTNHNSFRLYFGILMSSIGQEDYDEKLIEISNYYESKFSDEIDNNIKGVIFLIKANSYFNISKFGKSGIMYRKCLELVEVNSINYAWCYIGLANLCSFDDKRRCELLEKAREAFLLNGLRQDYAKATMKLIYFYKYYDLKGNRIEELFNELSYQYDRAEKSNEIDMKENILHEKADYFNKIGKKNEALDCIWDILKGWKNSFGKEGKRLPSIHLGLLIASELQDVDALKKLEEIKNVQEKRFKLNSDEFEAYMQKEEITSALMEKRFNDITNIDLKKLNKNYDWLIPVIKSMSLEIDVEDRIEHLEEALDIITNKYSFHVDYLELIYWCFALEYVNIDIEETLKWSEKALKINPFNYNVIKLYCESLYKIKDWKRLLEFYKGQQQLWGKDDINILWSLGRINYELHNFRESAKYLQKVLSDIPEAKEYFINAVNFSIEKGEEISIEEEENRKKVTYTIHSLYSAILEFSHYIASEMRMTFWKYDKEDKKHHWIQNPEEHAKQLLQTFMKAKFADDIEIFPECIVGAGRIDLYIILKENIKVTLELKMCGGGSYSSSYALEGFEQLSHYTKQKKVHIGYLVVFDGRTRDFSKDIPERIHEDKLTFDSIIVDVRPKVKSLVK